MASKHIPKFMCDAHFALENTPGTTVDPDATKALPFTRIKINDDAENESHQGPGADMDTVAQFMTGRKVTYEAEGNVDIDAIGYVLANAYSGYTYTAEGTIHTWAGGDWDITSADTVHINRRQPWTITENPKNFGETSAKARMASACVGSRLEIHGEEDKALTWKVNGIGFKCSNPAKSVTNVVPSQSPVLHGHGVWTLQIGSGTVHTVVPTEFTLVLENNLKPLRTGSLDANLYGTSDYMPGLREHTLNLKIPTRADYAADIVDYLAGARTDTVEIIGTFTVGSETLTITMSGAKPEGADPLDEITKDEEAHSMDLNFKAAAGTPVQLDLVSSIAEDAYYYGAA